MKSWKLHDAKARINELVKEATNNGPQEITLQGVPTVIVISRAEYDKLLKPKPHFLDFMRQSPLAKTNILIKRERSLNREIDF